MANTQENTTTINSKGPMSLSLISSRVERSSANTAKWFLLYLLSLFLILSPNSALASGIGFRDFAGQVTIVNSSLRGNFNGIQVSTTNAASTANKTVGNLFIDHNTIEDSQWHGIKIDLSQSGAITVENNTLDNSNVPSTAPFTKNGRFGIRIQNHPSPSIANNTVKNFGRSGIQLQNISQITVVNNLLQSNGTQDYTSGSDHYAAGFQTRNSSLSNISGNTILWNFHAGIAIDGSPGVIGPNNTIRYDGDPDGPPFTPGGGSLVNCQRIGFGSESARGGILVRGLGIGENLSVDCNNTISSNYFNEIAKTGLGLVTSCGNAIVQGTIFSDSSAVYYYNEESGKVIHDCGGSVINAATDKGSPRPFGILIEGSNSDVTVRNCTIKNAAMSDQYRATIANAIETKYLGAGVFIVDNAPAYISSNYIYSNGWGLLDDRVYTEAGASGVQMWCGTENLSIINNVIASNKNDGISARESGGVIGAVNMGNTFRNNGRGGIGLNDGTTRNLEIAYNTMHHNKRGVGAIDFDGTKLTIANNLIYTNLYANQSNMNAFGGITFNAFSGIGMIEANTIRNNTGQSAGGGIWATASNGTLSLMNNEIMNNISSVVGGMGLNDFSSGLVYLEGNKLQNNVGRIGGFGVTASNGAFSLINNQVMDNIGSTDDVNLMNVGGVGFNSLDPTATIYLSGNTLQNNQALVPGGPIRGRVGALGFSDTNATVSLMNNTIANNNAICIGGAGFDRYGGDVLVSSNVIYSNTSSKSAWGAGGLAFDEASGTITIANNSVYNNTNIATGSGGIGLNYLQATASVLIENNKVFSNSGHKLGGIGIINPTSTNVMVSQNTIFNNAESGLGVWAGSFINIQNNLILSNGLDNVMIGDERHASGIQLRDSTFTNNNISNNTIRNSVFTGIALYNTQGYFGPDNSLINNGIGSALNWPSCSGVAFGPGLGDGAVAVRDLSSPTDTVIVSGNVIESNNINSVARLDCTGEVRLDGNDIPCSRIWNKSDVVVYVEDGLDIYVNGVSVTNNSVIDCANDPAIPQPVTGGNLWGIAVMDLNQEVTIRNCTVENNMLYTNHAGPADTSFGGGILVAPGAQANIYNNVIRSNGAEQRRRADRHRLRDQFGHCRTLR